VTWTHDTCSPDAHLLIQVRLKEGSTPSEVLLKIKERKAVLEATLLAHFGYHAVQVLDVISSTSRRLSDQVAVVLPPGWVVSLEAVLLLHGAPVMPGAAGLAQALQKAFSDAGASLQIESATLQAKVLETPANTPNTSPDRNTAEDSSSALIIVSAGSGAAAVLLATACGWLLWSSRNKRAVGQGAPGKPESAAAQGDLEGGTTKEDEIQDEKIKEKTDHSDGMDSVSTGTPASQTDFESDSVTPTTSDAQDVSM